MAVIDPSTTQDNKSEYQSQDTARFRVSFFRGIVEEAERYTIAQWAGIRGVTEDAVRSNVNSAREKLLAEENRESSGESS